MIHTVTERCMDNGYGDTVGNNNDVISAGDGNDTVIAEMADTVYGDGGDDLISEEAATIS